MIDVSNMCRRIVERITEFLFPSMNNLFKESKLCEKKRCEEELKELFKKIFFDEKKHNDDTENLQNKINSWINLRSYEHIRNLKIKKIRAILNNLFETNKAYLDQNEETFRNAFAGQFRPSSFELVMAEFVGNAGEEFKLNIRQNPIKNGSELSKPDLRFKHGNKPYFMECSTRISSRMNEFCELLEKFDGFLNAAQVFYKKNEDLKKLHSYDYDPWHFGASLDRIWPELNSEEQNVVKNLNDSENTPLQKIKDWVYLSKYAYMHFKEILPQKIIDGLTSISLSVRVLSGNEQDDSIFLNFFAEKSIARVILDKLKKPYFSENDPGIIAISVSNLDPGLAPSFFSIGELSSYLEKNLAKLLNKLVKDEEKEKILNNQKNLYAVLIDTTNYNWFPEIARECYGANFPEGYDNCYLVINNLGFSSTRKEWILNSLVPHSIEILLNIGDSPGECSLNCVS